MSRVIASANTHLQASPERVLEFLSDYKESRPRILTDGYTAYRVEAGGTGDGTVYAYHFAAGGRERDYRMHVRARPTALEEQDELSSFVTTWTVEAEQAGSRVTLESSWNGAGGIGGFFERTFAPMGMRKIYGQVLDRLRNELGA